MKMIKKGLAVAVILLFIGVAFAIPINAKDIEINDDTTEPQEIGRTIVRGMVTFPFVNDDMITFFALNVKIINITGTERNIERWQFEWITLPENIVILYRTFFIFYRLDIKW